MGLFKNESANGVQRASDEMLNDFLNSPLAQVEDDLSKRDRHQELTRYISMGKDDPAAVIKHIAALATIGGIVSIAQDPNLQAIGVIAATAAPLLPASRSAIEALRHKMLNIAHSMMPDYLANEQGIIKDHMHYLFDKHGTTELDTAIKAEYPLLPESSQRFIEIGILQRAKDFKVIPQSAIDLNDMRLAATNAMKEERSKHKSNQATAAVAHSINDSYSTGRKRS